MVYGRMIEIYLVTSVAPIPMATMVNHEWGSMGQNYLKSLLALGFQAFLILVCVGIYAVLIQTIAATDDISGAIWACMTEKGRDERICRIPHTTMTNWKPPKPCG